MSCPIVNLLIMSTMKSFQPQFYCFFSLSMNGPYQTMLLLSKNSFSLFSIIFQGFVQWTMSKIEAKKLHLHHKACARTQHFLKISNLSVNPSIYGRCLTGKQIVCGPLFWMVLFEWMKCSCFLHVDGKLNFFYISETSHWKLICFFV